MHKIAVRYSNTSKSISFAFHLCLLARFFGGVVINLFSTETFISKI